MHVNVKWVLFSAILKCAFFENKPFRVSLKDTLYPAFYLKQLQSGNCCTCLLQLCNSSLKFIVTYRHIYWIKSIIKKKFSKTFCNINVGGNLRPVSSLKAYDWIRLNFLSLNELKFPNFFSFHGIYLSFFFRISKHFYHTYAYDVTVLFNPIEISGIPRTPSPLCRLCVSRFFLLVWNFVILLQFYLLDFCWKEKWFLWRVWARDLILELQFDEYLQNDLDSL